jgi:hypothetical protein
MFSVGVNPIRAAYNPDGVLEVAGGDWQELSLLPVGAFTDALVTEVAASAGPEPEPEPDDEEPRRTTT